MMMGAKKFAILFFGFITVGSIGVVLFSPGTLVGKTMSMGGLPVNTFADPFSMDPDFQGTLLAEETLGLHEPALPVGFEFEGTINPTWVEETSTALLAEILAGQAISGTHLQGESILIDLSIKSETDLAAVAAQAIAETQVQKEIKGEHHYFGSCGAY